VAKGRAITADAQHGVLVNDGDLDGDRLSVSAVNGSGANVGQTVVGTYGSLTVNTDGSYSYVANKGNLPPQIVAQDSFTYTASDGHGGTQHGHTDGRQQYDHERLQPGGGWIGLASRRHRRRSADRIDHIHG
jgi:VCBS repeat-containing protein